MADLPARVLAAIREHRLLAPGDAVLVAVSGGCDSMVLLELLHRLSAKAGWRLAVAHYNHQLRGRASEADEALVARTARRLGLPFHAGRGRVRTHARARGLSLEMAARELRHEFLAATAREIGVVKIALAHHADDQVETFFLRVLRGGGGEGLAGMKWRSSSPADPGRQLIRPLLAETRARLAAYAAAGGVEFREDASNRQLDTPRNILRRRVLPMLRRLVQPALEVTVPRLMTLIGDEAGFAAAAARSWLAGRRRDAFARLHPAVQRHVIQMQLRKLGVEPGFDLVERLRRAPDCPTMTPGGLRVWRDHAGRVLAGEAPKLEFATRQLAVELTTSRGECEFAGLRLAWRVRRRRTGAPVRIAAKTGLESLDADRVGRRILLRHWQAGDRFQPLGLARAAKLQDLFTNAKVPRAERRQRVVAASEGGAIFWVEGLRPGEPVRLTPASRRVLEWRWARPGVSPSVWPDV
jgi:tRNA(Ile)-lysidine synthase